MAEHSVESGLPPILGFRRRCAWCGVQLRGWQLNLCRICKRAVVYNPSPPVPHASRWDAAPDEWRTRVTKEADGGEGRG